MSGFRELASAHLGYDHADVWAARSAPATPATPAPPRKPVSTPRLCNRWTPKGPCQLISGHGFAHDGISGAAARADAAANRLEREIAKSVADHKRSTCEHCKLPIHTFNGGKKWTHIATAKRRCTTLKAKPMEDTR